MRRLDEQIRRSSVGLTTMQPLRILCFTSRELCGICLQLLLRDFAADASVTVTCGLEETLAAFAAAEGQYDVVLFAAICGDALTRVPIPELCGRIGTVPLVVHLDVGTQAEVDSLVAQGARGVIPTSSSAAVAVAGIRLVAAGGLYLPQIDRSRPTHRIAAGSPAASGSPEPPILTRREGEVLQLVGMGMNNLAIADKLGIAEATVKVYIGRLRKRLGVNDRAQMVLSALRLRAIRAQPGGETAADL